MAVSAIFQPAVVWLSSWYNSKTPIGTAMHPQHDPKKIATAFLNGSMIRRIVARLVVARSNDLDIYARLSMLEGLLNKPSGSMSRGSYRHQLEDARGQIDPSRWASEKEYEKFFDPKANLHFPKALGQGAGKAISKVPQWLGSAGRMNEEEIVQSLMGGLTLGTGAQAKGGNIFRRTGLSHKSTRNLAIKGLYRALQNNAYSATVSLIPSNRAPDVRGDAPVGGEEDAPSLMDFQTGNAGSTGDELLDVLSELGGLRLADRALRRQLSESQLKVWDVVLSDPGLIRYESGKLGLKANDAAKVYERLHGVPIAPSTVRKNFLRFAPKLWDALTDPKIMKPIMDRKELMEVINEERRMRASKKASASRVASRYLEACGDEPCATCEGCGCGGTCDGSCSGNEEAMMEKTSPAPELPPGKG